MRGYAKDAAPRGKHAAKKARQGEGALDEEFDPAYDSEPDDCFDDAAPTAAPTAVKGKRALGPQARLEQTPDQGLVFWCALCNDKKPVQSTKATSRASERSPGVLRLFLCFLTCLNVVQAHKSLNVVHVLRHGR